MTPPLAPALLSAELIALIAQGVSTLVASSDAQGRSSLMRAVGAGISHDGREVRVFLNRSQSQALLDAIAATGRVAVVFSQPQSMRTVQLKSSGAQLCAASVADEPLLHRYALAMEKEMASIGFGRRFARAMLAYEFEDLVVVTFCPEMAFDQTPGPRAGAPLGSGGPITNPPTP